jgi:hypothetical protein
VQGFLDISKESYRNPGEHCGCGKQAFISRVLASTIRETSRRLVAERHIREEVAAAGVIS